MTQKIAPLNWSTSSKYKQARTLVYIAIFLSAFILLIFSFGESKFTVFSQISLALSLFLLLATLCYVQVVLKSKKEKPTPSQHTTIVPPAEAAEALHALPDLIWTIDYASRRVTAQNQALSTTHPDGIEQTKLASLFPARVSRQFLESLIKIQNTQTAQRFEYQLDNTEITFEARLSPLTTRSCVVIIRDISSTKAIETALFQQQMFTQQILDANPSLIFVRDQHKRFLLVNQATQSLLGHELLVQSHMGLDEDTSILTKGDDEVLEHGNTVRLEDHCTLSNGRTHWFDLTKIPLEREGQVYILTIAIDITHLKEAEQAQAGTSHLVRAMADVLPQPFLLVENEVIQFANMAACARLGVTPENLIGECISQFAQGEHQYANLTHLKNIAGEAIDCALHKVDRGNQNTHLVTLQ
ncbi:PAS domain-containing protein [Deefgea tanakiae]|uniref:PAS domain-containing protein n=1 Tax=Deefgea tanakiae TaxID=2865840 RepID=A0ABX8Z2E7_9NEIS|nr:PAS domain-containing protein [Deefgea tanakiae]QZA76525.1 PAS domain-containing protein [Deefgea tanakiae]